MAIHTFHERSFCVRSNVLYKNFNRHATEHLLIVPSALHADILSASHDEPSSGHLGFTRTLARIRQHYYWPKLTQDVKHYVKMCRECQRRKAPPQRPAGFLKPIVPPAQPFQQIGMDLLGPFPKSHDGNRWIVVATDYMTRYCEIKALPRGTASEIAHFFMKNIVLRHGAPAVVITDRGTAFTAQMMEDVLQLSGTAHRKTTAYHPQSNGLTERINKTITDMLSMYVDRDHKNWDDILPYITFAYNTAVQETTGFTPFRLLHGREAATMLDVMLLPNRCDVNVNTNEFIRLADTARKLALKRIHNQQ